MSKLLIIDNYDSFTWNLYQYFCELGQQVEVRRHDRINIREIEQLAPHKLVISPGPGTPDQAGISLSAIHYFSGKLPILGVCLGHQAIGQAFGAKVVRAHQVMHGKISYIRHSRTGLFAGLIQPLKVIRYNSLVLDPTSIPSCLEVTAWSLHPGRKKEEIMAISHRSLAITGVQFHPESIMSEQGHQLLANFLQLSS
ncbi:anthranilate synthase component II [Candidatus Palibaumannia cicadellinicola]|uniref:Para-aminobenzoate synthase, glutamine amidotransferase component n=1 Tax=Baumannia cicadellinicola subsp. Homalodisca coagulata TaxID=374463 RepID=Q1LST5_BAUCH|nr:aminodeoxychorismate/anthranilate synthase component II [Candidatus Baumannia cicadellinicola]ABF14005.1 Para-aminobenzoate synthase, glutamine amidotransferase component [Baumannia cicadellinicola str. Hc (Homalodisca coagulata)]MBS0032550.1 aminodeoxychorismate/anthranilate synthase component II [Candidatus Baumannia cicadellinicola]MCJ7462159.1 aminodeoxychorismate/anthranilate synthase component II [Candidatus Baumannia cicadellinicola]MCJ7463015.1 aminodeoxychorismate/anthranilate synth